MNKKIRFRKEVQAIYNSEEMLKELNRIYLEGVCIDEYEKLLEEYKRLYKRYEKIMKVSDLAGHSIMQKYDLLNNNFDYAIKTARHNLFENTAEHKKTKVILSNYKEKMYEYENALNELLNENTIIQKKLNSYEKHFGEIKHQFLGELDLENRNKKEKKFENISFEKIISLAFDKTEDNYILIKLKLRNFDKNIQIIEEKTSVKSFIEKIYTFVERNLNNDSILYYETKGIFYIVLVNEEIEDAKSLEKKINSKRDIYNVEIAFNMAISTYIKEEDSIDRILRRCDIGLDEAISKNKVIVCKKDDYEFNDRI